MWSIPDDLMDELQEWYDTDLLRGAIKALSEFTGKDVPKVIFLNI